MLSYLSTMLGEFKGIIQSAAIHNTSVWASHGAIAPKHFMEEHEKDLWLHDHKFKQCFGTFKRRGMNRVMSFTTYFVLRVRI